MPKASRTRACTSWASATRSSLPAPPRLVRARECLVETDAGVFIRTPPGGAQYLASVIDLSGQPEILGSIAGDDTILVFAKKPFTISELLLLLTELAGFTNGQNPVRPDDLLDEGRASSPATPTDKTPSSPSAE